MVNKHLRISIVTPSFNQGEYLEQTIQSVLNQNYPNLEYIIIDGGSTDNSVEIIKKYAKYLKYWVSEPDRGQTHAINKGFEMVSGDVFNWLNSDDYYIGNVFERINDHFLSHNAEVVMGKSVLFDENTGKEKVSRGGHLYSSLEKTIGDALLDQPAAFFRYEAFAKVNPLDESFRYLMDRVMWVKYLIINGKNGIAKVDDQFVKFRLHDSSKTVSEKKGFLLERNGIYASLCESLGLEDEIRLIKDNLEITEHPIKWPNEIVHFDGHKVISEFLLICAAENYADNKLDSAKILLANVNRHLLSEESLSEYSLLRKKLVLPNRVIKWVKKIT